MEIDNKDFCYLWGVLMANLNRGFDPKLVKIMAKLKRENSFLLNNYELNNLK